jgi:cobalt/nickel transport system permease protein
MHIMEGFLPVTHAGAWWAVMLPVLWIGVGRLKADLQDDGRRKVLLVMAAAFAFVLSALKLPSVTGSCSHPTGLGLGTILFGPWAMAVVGLLVLVFQALLLAHGGISTLGANTFSMGIVGPFVTYGCYKLAQKLGCSKWVAVFLAAALGDLATYGVTSFQLGLAFPDPSGQVSASMIKFLGIFAITQLPLAVSEGILTVMVLRSIESYAPWVVAGTESGRWAKVLNTSTQGNNL